MTQAERALEGANQIGTVSQTYLLATLLVGAQTSA